MKKVLNRQICLIIIDIILLIVSIATYKHIYKVEIAKRTYLEESTKFAEENKIPIFKIGKIILYSSANAVDNSDGNLKDIDISQFTDMLIYIDNTTKTSELSAENTVSQIYVDKIKITSKSNEGQKIFNYKDPLSTGKYADVAPFSGNGILFNVTNSNEENQSADYGAPVFYTDCSNPLSFGLVNKNILTGCQVNSNNGSIAFDGSILKSANIDLKDLQTTINMSIYLRNNYNEEFVCNLSIDNDLIADQNEPEIYSGYLMKIIDTKDEVYNFLKIS